MLTGLSVRNIVLIDQLDLGLGPGLTVLTGETGAGKSILLDALTLALGGRGDATLVRAGCDNGQVVAVFQLEADHPARQFLRGSEIADDREVILRRVQHADGRTRAFVNDQPVSAGLLQTVGGLLAEIHGQHDSRALVDPATHRAALDAFAGAEQQAQAVRSAYSALVEANEAVAQQQAAIAQATAQEEFARAVIDELEALAPKSGEEAALAERRAALMQLQRAAEDVDDAEAVLTGSQSPAPVLSTLVRKLRRKADAVGQHLAPLVDALDATLNALDGAAEALDTLKRDLNYNPGELDEIETRLFALKAAARKHRVAADALEGVLQSYRAQIEALTDGAAALRRLEKKARAALSDYSQAAKALSATRSAAAATLAHAVTAELPDLRLASARFLIDQQRDETRLSPSGYDQIAFHVATNPGTSPGPLLKVASGGELSRFLLALKVVLADRGSAPVLVFDEIDTGVGGAVADAMGRRLGRLARRVQVLAVTHAPQVAARATTHFVIEKQAIEEGAFMRTFVRPLDPAARREEVARMLAGAKVTDEARAAASRLIAEVG